MIPLTERLLADAGGWQVMKQARGLHDLGRVTSASYEPPLLHGRVREGETEYRAGLRILSRTNIENVCGCRDSRQRGMICAHSLAVGLEVMKPRGSETPAALAKTAVAAAPIALPTISAEGEGTWLELFVILAPNTATAWEKNAITVGAEVVIDGRRSLLSALEKSRVYRCSEADLRVVDVLRAINGGELPGMAMVSRDHFAELLGALSGHPRVTLGKAMPVAVNEEPLRPRLVIDAAPDGALRLRVELPGEGRLLVGGGRAWLLRGAEFTPISPGLPAAYHSVLQREVTIPAEQAANFAAREVPLLRAHFEIDSAIGEIAAGQRQAAEPAAFFLKLEGSLNHLAAELECRRGERRRTVAESSADADERVALDRLRRCGFTGPDAKGQLILKGEPAILSFFARELPRLQREWTVTIGARFEHVTREVDRIEPRLEIRSSGEQWFDLNVELGTAGGERFSAAEIQRLLQSGRNSVRLRNGRLAVFDSELLDEFQNVLIDCDPQQRQPGLFRIDRRHAAYLDSVATEHHVAVESAPGWQEWAKAPRDVERLQPIPLGDLEPVLRPYQKLGVYWMHFLAQNGWGGILADEMGLGKTLQALAYLRTVAGRALVVCPSSLVSNWEREAGRFTPGRKVLVLQGPRRHEAFAQIDSADLVVTSYPLLRRDADRYRGMNFAAMVLDEAQHIKNPESQNAQAAQIIRAQRRFILTGTPIENSLRDIWSLMNFLMPGYLGSRNDFKERFEQAMQADPPGPEQRRLLQRIRPFVLRRLKQSVAPELPEKIEQVAYCALTPAQQSAYDELLKATRRQVSELAGTKDQNKARILMLTALLRLRQACCDLRLLDLPDVQREESSAKLELLDELLQEAIDGGHRVLIFSQFVSMLQLIRQQLEASGTRFNYLDGSTTKRQAVVDEFQRGDAPVFLISLKAGGVGLNLTAADTVVHFDPWWNPAVENQATDRAHRIGQKKVVTSYKLIARGTVEEKILALQTRKRALVDATIESEQPLMEGLSREEIEALIT